MTSTDTLQLFGSAAVAGLGLLFYRISTKDSDWFCRYGREALVVASAFQFTAVAVRMAVYWGYVTQTDGRTINGLVAFGFLAILVQIVLAHRVTHREGAT